MTGDITTQPTADEDWDVIQALFPLGRTKMARSWNLGLSSRMTRERLGVLTRRDGAGKLDRLLENRAQSRVKALRTYAAINLEQAAAAFRITVVGNVTIPVIVLTVLNLILPGSPAELFRFAFEGDDQSTRLLMGALLVYLCALAAILGYSVVQLYNARDIRHLIDLHAARRGIYFGLEDMDDLQSG